MKLYVAVVMKVETYSRRALGDWSAFVEDDANVALDRAKAAKEIWERNTDYGSYVIATGTLTERVEALPVRYKVTSLTPKPRARKIRPVKVIKRRKRAQ